MTEDHACDICQDHGWVCENHPFVAWAGMTGAEECCGGAGAPCCCNPDGEVDLAPLPTQH
ncbi:hypothetical protein [Sphingomonas sp. CCH5-D11]|uniref:hypothetical protein n=1 Tax=Sphingomonas sp. CCH5-D11 TaxID=1768786 RepID=UPI0009E8C757|nr:hypothetical protein [Sphingomonas sp. CCH5-D11]